MHTAQQYNWHERLISCQHETTLEKLSLVVLTEQYSGPVLSIKQVLAWQLPSCGALVRGD